MSENSQFYNLIEFGTLTDLNNALTVYRVNAQDEEGMSLLAWACVAGKKQKVAYLLEQGADPNIKCNDGRTPLMYAASNDYPEIIRVLLKAGANPKISDKTGWTAEVWADVLWNEKCKFVLREHRKGRLLSQAPKGKRPHNDKDHSR